MTVNDRQAAFGDLEGKQGDDAQKNNANDAVKGGEQKEPQKDPEPPKAKYTDEDLEKIIAKTIAKERAKADKALAQQKEDLTEAQKLESMTAQEKAEHNAKKLQKELDALKAEKNLNEQMAVARKELADAGINMSDKLLSMFVSPEAEATKAAIDDLKQLWESEVNARVQARLQSPTPPAEGRPAQGKSRGAEFAQKYSNEMNGGK